MPTYSNVSSLLSRYAGNGNTLLDRINLVRARLLASGNWVGSKEQILLTAYSDRDGNTVVTLPSRYTTILGGAYRSTDVLCAGTPMGVVNSWGDFSKTGLGYGATSNDFREIPGRFCVFQEWDSSMRLRFKFETSESAGTIHIRGTLDGEKVYSLYSATWIEGEKLDFSGTTTITSTKYFDPDELSIVKPTTLGRVTMFTLDSDSVETQVATYESSDTVPRWKRYRVPQCETCAAVTATTPVTPSQYYTRTELDAMFSTETAISVSSTGTHDLVYSAYYLRVVPISAAAGSGSYTHNFTLDNAYVKDGGTLRARVAIVASANPILKFYDNTTGGTLLYEINGDSSNAQAFTLVFSYDSDTAAWSFEGREL